MGMDIHTYIVDKTGKIKYKDLYEGRNSEWFADLTKRAEYNMAYMNFNPNYGLSKGFDPNTDPEYANDECDNEDHDVMKWCFDFRNIKVKDFVKWYKKSKPYRNAGWCTKYEAWLYKEKGIIPEELATRLYDDDIVTDKEFIVVNNPWDPATVIYNFIKKHHNIKLDDYFNYFFDN